MTSAAERKRQQRAREKAGQAIIPVRVDEARVATMLASAGVLSPALADDKTAIGEAIEMQLELLCQLLELSHM